MDDQGIGYRNEILYGYCNIDEWNEFYKSMCRKILLFLKKDINNIKFKNMRLI